MRILNVVYLFPRFSETFISLLLAELTGRGWDNHILSQRDPRTPEGKAWEDNEPETLVHAHVVQSGLLDHVSYFGTADRLNQQLTAHATSGFYDLALFHWSDFLKQILAWEEKLPIPVVVSCHEPDFTSTLPIFAQRAQVLERVSAIIVEGRYQYDMLLGLGYPAERLLYWKSGVDLLQADAAFVSRPPSLPEPDRLRLVSAGRFVEKKGFMQALEAVRLLRERGLSLTYNLIGDGEQRGEIEQFITRYKLNQIVTLPGKVMHPNLFNHLVAGDINLIPSGTASDGDREGVMSTLVEGLACRRVVIGTRHGGTPEILEHGVTGWILENNRPETIADAVQYLAQNPQLRHQLGIAAHATVRDRFELQDSITRLGHFLYKVQMRHSHS